MNQLNESADKTSPWHLAHFKRSTLFLIFDVLAVTLSLYLAILFRFDFNFSSEYWNIVLSLAPFFIIIKLMAFASFNIYKTPWRYFSLTDLIHIVTSLAISESILFVLFLWLQTRFPVFPAPANGKLPGSIFVLDFTNSLFLISGLRISKRVLLEVVKKRHPQIDSLKTVIIGAGHTGEMIMRDMGKYSYAPFYPVAFLDDDKKKHGSYIHGVPVLGPMESLRHAISKYRAQAVIIAIPSLGFTRLRRIYELAKEVGMQTIKVIPRIYDFQKPQVNLKNLEDISIEDLIGRQIVNVDTTEISRLLRGKSILITGAGGSIGSEITAQVCGFHPSEIILFDIDETSLHNMQLRLERGFPDLKDSVHLVVGNILDIRRLEYVFENLRPSVVFHAAAYKHVPMMEFNATEAVRTNIFGTYNVARLAVKYGTQRFVMISTDKVVRPTSVMGATKRVAEEICISLNSSNETSESKTEFVAVRFGNVLGSRGSVLPLFLEQLKRGGPLTVTHKDMRRYFMTIPEAVSLVLQASVIGKGGEVLVLDMGEPMRIVDLAEELIRIHGMQPYKDIGIEFIGLRPGEKLFEEILTSEEGTTTTKHQKIFVARNSGRIDPSNIDTLLDDFEAVSSTQCKESGEKVKALLRKHVKHFEAVED